MAFRVGQKVVCVDDNFDKRAKNYFTALPVRGEIYVVRGTLLFPDAHLGIALVGFPGERTAFNEFGEHMFFAKRFRPVVERKTDISIFEKMLTGGNQPARVS